MVGRARADDGRRRVRRWMSFMVGDGWMMMVRVRVCMYVVGGW